MFLSSITISATKLSETFGDKNSDFPTFGKEIKKYFLFGKDEYSENVAFCNHGAKGATPIYVIQKRFELIRSLHLNPDRWFQDDMPRMELLATKKLADFIGASSPNDLVFVSNVTEGINTVLKVKNQFIILFKIYYSVLITLMTFSWNLSTLFSLLQSIVLQPRDKVICTSHTFISVRNILEVWTKMYDADVLCLDIPSCIKSEEEVNY